MKTLAEIFVKKLHKDEAEVQGLDLGGNSTTASFRFQLGMLDRRDESWTTPLFIFKELIK